MSDGVAANRPVAARGDVLGVWMDGSQVLYDPESGRSHVLNHSAGTIWGMLRSTTSVGEIAARLAAELDRPFDAIQADVAGAIALFVDQGLADVGVGDSIRRREPPDRARHLEPESRTPPSRLRSRTMALFDQRVAFGADDPAVVADVNWFGAPLVTEGTADREIQVQPTVDFARRLPAQLNQLAATSSGSTVIHAGGVVVGDAAVAFPGAPRAGKSTLVAALVQRGFGYLTDEALGLTRTGPDETDLAVAGYPKRIALELGSWPLFPEVESATASNSRDGFDPTRVRWIDGRDLNPSALAWREDGAALRLRLCVAPSFDAGTDLDLVRLSRLDAMTTLLNNNFNLASMGTPGLEAFRDVAMTVPFYRLTHGGLGQALPALEELFAAEGVDAKL